MEEVAGMGGHSTAWRAHSHGRRQQRGTRTRAKSGMETRPGPRQEYILYEEVMVKSVDIDRDPTSFSSGRKRTGTREPRPLRSSRTHDPDNRDGDA
jgi:hypothetical protein